MLDSALTEEWTQPLVPERDKLLIRRASPFILDALDPMLPSDDREELLRMQFKNVTLRDAIASGNATLTSKGWKLSTSRPLESFKGLVMEASICRQCFDDRFGIGRNVFAWCTGRTLGQVSETLIGQHIPFLTADKSLEKSPLTARFYDPASAYDIHFYKINDKGNAEFAHEIGLGKGIVAGLQVKAIQGNERTEIIDKLISGRYTRVLTMLKHPNGVHSYEVCKRLLLQMAHRGEISGDQVIHVLSRLTYPEALGIKQNNVESYSRWLNLAYAGFESWENSLDVVESIGIEVISRLKPTDSGLLMPDAPEIKLPPTFH